MPTSTREVTIVTCDAPNCTVQHVSADELVAETKFPHRGTVIDVAPDGTQAERSWFACKPAHVKKAVLAAQGIEDGQVDETGGA